MMVRKDPVGTREGSRFSVGAGADSAADDGGDLRKAPRITLIQQRIWVIRPN